MFFIFPFGKPEEAFDWVVLPLIWLIELVITSLIAYGICWIINFANLPDLKSKAVIIDKERIPAHYNFVSTGETTVPIFVPEDRRLIIRVKNQIDDYSVSEDQYYNYKAGDTLTVTYRNGRLWNSLLITKII